MEDTKTNCQSQESKEKAIALRERIREYNRRNPKRRILLKRIAKIVKRTNSEVSRALSGLYCYPTLVSRIDKQVNILEEAERNRNAKKKRTNNSVDNKQVTSSN